MNHWYDDWMISGKSMNFKSNSAFYIIQKKVLWRYLFLLNYNYKNFLKCKKIYLKSCINISPMNFICIYDIRILHKKFLKYTVM